MSTARVEELEIKVAFLENHVAELDTLVQEAMLRQERVEKQLLEALERVASVQEAIRSPPGHERPPHHLPDPLDGLG